jgi:hypothetical protein
MVTCFTSLLDYTLCFAQVSGRHMLSHTHTHTHCTAAALRSSLPIVCIILDFGVRLRSDIFADHCGTGCQKSNGAEVDGRYGGPHKAEGDRYLTLTLTLTLTLNLTLTLTLTLTQQQ